MTEVEVNSSIVKWYAVLLWASIVIKLSYLYITVLLSLIYGTPELGSGQVARYSCNVQCVVCSA